MLAPRYGINQEATTPAADYVTRVISPPAHHFVPAGYRLTEHTFRLA